MDQREHEASEYPPQNPPFEWKFASSKSSLERFDTDYAPNQPSQKIIIIIIIIRYMTIKMLVRCI